MSAQDYDNQQIVTELLGRYLTATGKIGVEIFKHTMRGSRHSYSYRGKWGAGSGSGNIKENMGAILNSILRHHPRHTIEVNFFDKVKS